MRQVCGIQTVEEGLMALSCGANTIGLLVGLTHKATDEISVETAKIIWENMDKVDSEEALTDLITAEFEVSRKLASTDVAAFIKHLETML